MLQGVENRGSLISVPLALKVSITSKHEKIMFRGLKKWLRKILRAVSLTMFHIAEEGGMPTSTPSSFPCFFGVKKGKPPKKQGLFSPPIPSNSRERRGKHSKT